MAICWEKRDQEISGIMKDIPGVFSNAAPLRSSVFYMVFPGSALWVFRKTVPFFGRRGELLCN
jgi:hypothetical protein